MNRPSELSVPYPVTADIQDVSPPPATSAVSWAAIIAGAAAAAALSLILLVLGTGLGLSFASPWVNSGISAATFGVSTILWITFTQIFASGLGGYLAGRLRHKWLETQADEVFFRDTVHGFLTWAVASIASAALLTSTIGSIVNLSFLDDIRTESTASTMGNPAHIGSVIEKDKARTMTYFVDSLFRKDPQLASDSADASTNANLGKPGTNAFRAEVALIFMNSIGAEALPEDDSHYIGQLVAAQTGLPQQNAEKRVGDAYARLKANFNALDATAQEAADKARKASAYAALWLFISLLIGAFVASLAATFGGRQRDI
ncbi:hypothetical protein ACUHMQ_19275 [Chitinimonas sp. PSY-7]|uniref:hypothetical protein n=1 Tax=Chitinimonas sp. PSY-7 TaxID=3459088 RepID=UPI0040400C68